MAEWTRDAIVERFDPRALDYDSHAMHRELAVAVAEFVILDEVRTVVDVGTGTGLVLRALTTLSAAGLRLIGVDISPGMLSVARSKLPDAQFFEADAAVLPLSDGSVDLVTCVAALHLLPDPAAAFSEWSRILRRGGSLVTATFAEFDPQQHFRHQGSGTTPSDDALPIDHESFRTPSAIAAIAAPAGLVTARHAVWTDGRDTVLITSLSRG